MAGWGPRWPGSTGRSSQRAGIPGYCSVCSVNHVSKSLLLAFYSEALLPFFLNPLSSGWVCSLKSNTQIILQWECVGTLLEQEISPLRPPTLKRSGPLKKNTKTRRREPRCQCCRRCWNAGTRMDVRRENPSPHPERQGRPGGEKEAAHLLSAAQSTAHSPGALPPQEGVSVAFPEQAPRELQVGKGRGEGRGGDGRGETQGKRIQAKLNFHN